MDDREPWGTTEEELAIAVSELKSLSAYCARISSYVGVITLLHLLLVITSTFALSGPRLFNVSMDLFRLWLVTLAGFDTFVLLMVIILVWRFDLITRKGHLLYQEISDEVEKGELLATRNLNIRLALRQFVLDATLPLNRTSENGAMIFIGANVALTAWIWVNVLRFF